jgi:hypothetical protein
MKATAQRPVDYQSGPRSAARNESSRVIRNSPFIGAQRRRLTGMFGGAMQRKGDDEEELLQGKFELTQRKGPEEEELQKKEVSLKPAQPQSRRPTRSGNTTGLPDGLKFGIETLSGVSLNDVKVHYNSAQPAQLNALAYAQGSDIHIAPGQEKHLPHEAWHVVQQAEGRVKPTTQMKGGVPVNDDAGLEHEADALGAKAMSLKRQVSR